MNAARIDSIEKILESLPDNFEKLPDKYKQVIELHYLNDLPIREIKTMLGVSDSTVRNRILYGLFLLKKQVAKRPPL